MVANFHELQNMVFSSQGSAAPSVQDLTPQESRKRRAINDIQNPRNCKRPFHEDLVEKANCNWEEAVVYEDLSHSSVNSSHRNYRNVNQEFPEQAHLQFFPDVKFYDQTSDASSTSSSGGVAVNSDCSSVTQIYDLCPRYEARAGDVDNVADKRNSETTGDEQSFAMVPARTALLSAAVKYSVTVGELKRRINAPEGLHASLINGMLRKAKAKDGGDGLRRKLHTAGIELPVGRRKILPNTAFTALTETEAIHIAKDYTALLRREFRSKKIAAHMLENRRKRQNVNLNAERERLDDVRKFIVDLQRVLSRVGEHPCEYNEKENHEEIDKHVNHFSLVTHGFGNIAISGLLETVVKMIDESQSLLGVAPHVQYQAQPPRGQRPQGHHQQQYISPAMQLPKSGFMGMGYAPFMGESQYMMGQAGQPRL